MVHGAARPARVIAALVALALLAAACGRGAAAPGVASLGSSTTTTSTAGAQGGNKAADYADAVSYSQCMRTHGVPNMPDPTANGDFISNRGVLNGQRIDVGSSAYVKADKACSHLLPNGGQMTPAEQQQAIAQALKFVQCMRTHGVPNMPDPTAEKGGGVGILLKGLDPNSSQFRAAQTACRAQAPGGGR